MIELGPEGYIRRRRCLNRLTIDQYIQCRTVHFNLSGVERNHTNPRIFFFRFAKRLSHEPSLMALAPTSLLKLSGRTSGLVTRRSKVRLLLGELGFFSESPVSLAE